MAVLGHAGDMAWVTVPEHAPKKAGTENSTRTPLSGWRWLALAQFSVDFPELVSMNDDPPDPTARFRLRPCIDIHAGQATACRLTPGLKIRDRAPINGFSPRTIICVASHL